MNTNKLKGKDLITTGIFTVLFLVVVMAISLTIGMIPVVYPFIVPIGMIPCGIIWAYLRAKVPKRYGIFIQCTVISLFSLLTGMGWYAVTGIFIGGILAELIAGIGKYKSFKLTVASYAAFGVCYELGGFLIILLAGDYYYKNSVALGADTAYMDALLAFMSGPVLIIACVLSVVGAICGILLGKAFLKKRFERAGIV